ncbi:unnamed protein product [Periconia digitata]|uniref:Uncharacterized protein n=1 Tax=Periconia digitata TaxID=1303443 RepID=A0A9W4U5Y5_9PLEO|nr:unnamed protein product [Periconia digitata]
MSWAPNNLDIMRHFTGLSTISKMIISAIPCPDAPSPCCHSTARARGGFGNEFPNG